MRFPSTKRFNCFAAAVRLLPLLCCAVCAQPLHAPTSAFNPQRCSDRHPSTHLTAVWTSSPSLPRRPHSFLKPPQRSGLSARHHSLSPPPQVHGHFLFFFLSFLGLFHRCCSAPPCLPVGGQCTDQWETGECLLCFCSRSNGSRGAPPPWPDRGQLQTARPSSVWSSPLLNAKNRAF